MSGRGPMPCRFGADCHRKDCWYAHPIGRLIDAAGGGSNAGMTSSNGAGGAFGGVMGAGSGGGARPAMMSGGMVPHAAPRSGGGGGSGAGNECRYGFQCKRKDCHFNHPFGRAIDGAGGGGGSGRPSLNRLPSNNSAGSINAGMSELSFDSYPPANAADDDQDLKDTWFPWARDCPCCKGFVYGCTNDICESMGQCTCSIDEKDLDGGSDVASHISRPSSPQFGTGVEGSPVGGGGGWAEPPNPPTEETMAAAEMGTAAGGGGRRSGAGRGGGGAECRYGTGCKRANCSFSHPRGRTMDADGDSFGDFGGGGGQGHSGTKSTAEQDLMDTWYPDCRDCPCCKGYKHGCKTPACEGAGLCSCSSGDGPVAPIPPVTSLAATEGASAKEAAAAAASRTGPGGRGTAPPT